jgi:hypothetical protein
VEAVMGQSTPSTGSSQAAPPPPPEAAQPKATSVPAKAPKKGKTSKKKKVVTPAAEPAAATETSPSSIKEEKAETVNPAQSSESAPAAAAPPAEPKKEEAVPSQPAPATTGTFTDYFPAAQGMKWSYEYLKPAPGSETKKTRTVECVDAKTMPNGTLRVVLEVTEDGQQVRERYSLYDNKVEHTATGDKTFSGDFAFKLSKAGGAAGWSANGKSVKVSFGPAQVYQKTYPDCVIVSEKTAESKLISYYAKGIGLVAVEAYSKDMKLLQSKSLALIGGASDSSK